MSKEQLILRLDNAFLGMVIAESERDYAYEFGQFNAFLSMLFAGNMITFDEYKMLTDVKLSFYFSSVRNEVVFKWICIQSL